MKTIKADFRHYYDHNSATKRPGKRKKLRCDKGMGRAKGFASDYGDESLTNELSGHALREFFGNPYWLRLWIVQEIMLARYIRVICGETLLSWEEIRRFCSSGLKRLSPEAALAVPPQVIWLTQHALSDRQFTYPSLLHAFGTSGCENPRDKVYALQGVVQSENRPIVHYESSVRQVLQDAAKAMLNTALRDSQEWSGTDLSRINYTGSIKSAFLEAAALWMKELEGVIHLELIEAWIILQKEMGLRLIRESSAERSRILEAVRAMWSRLAHFHLRMFLAKHQLQSTDIDDLENNNPDNLSLDAERLETLITQLRNHYDALVKILRGIKMSIVRPKFYHIDDGLYYPETLVTQFGKPWYCNWECSQPATVHIIP
jgi:hypothetical protein